MSHPFHPTPACFGAYAEATGPRLRLTGSNVVGRGPDSLPAWAFLFTVGRELARAVGRLLCWVAVLVTSGLADLKAAEVAPSPLLPAAYAINSYDINDGLPHNTTFPILQTRDGYLWIATGAGLARFDGVRFVTFRVADTPALPDNLIRSLYEDDTGVLWVGTQRGLCRYREGRFEPVDLPDNPAVVSVVKDRSGRVWIGTLTRGLWEYRDGRVTEFKDPLISDDIRLRDVRTLFMDSTGRVWMWIRTKGVAYFDGTGLKLFDGFGVASDQGVPMAETSPGTLWFGTNQGVFRLRDGQLRAYGKEQGLGSATVRHLSADRQGRLWVAEGKVYLLENSEAESFVTAPLPAQNARWIIQDREGSHWVGTSTEGLWQFRPSAFRMLLPDNPLLDGNVRAVAVDRAGAIWAGLPTTGVARIAPNGELTVIATGVGTAGEVGTLWPATDGSVWIGTRGSLYVWREGDLREFSQFKDIRAIYQDRAGAIWFGAMVGGGVVRYQEGEFTSFAAVVGPPKNSTAAPVTPEFAEDAGGTLYLSLLFRGRGVIKLKDGAMTEIGPSEIFDACEIRAIYPDREGNLWVGTIGRGLVVYSQGRWLNPDSLSVPFNDYLNAVIEDDHGRMWFGTGKGILWAPKAELLAMARGERRTTVFRQAVAGDGIRPAQVGAGLFGSYPSVWKTPDGTIWFATKRGVVAVDTNKVANNPVAPLVKIERVVVGEKAVDPRDAIRLPAGTRALTIDYTALSFVRPGQVLFRYRLEGHDTNWTEAGTRRTAFFTNLDPGSYRFQVIACNSDGLWSESGASVAIVQQPFVYQTAWFWGTVAIGLLLIVLGIYRLRTVALRRRNEQMERRIAQRTAELAKSYEELKQTQQELMETSRMAGIAEMATGILHNLGNALNSVNTTVNLTTDRVQKSKITALGKVVRLLDEQQGRLAEFFSADARGKQLPGYLAQLSDHLLAERTDLLRELEALQQNVDHIKEMVAAQQSFAHVSGLTETVPAAELVELSLRLSEVALHRHVVTIVRELKPAPPVKVERQKAMQILVNLIRNAKEAINESGRPDKLLTVGVQVSAGGRVQISVTDNGVGIAAENLARVFNFGYTTKKTGHGFGLHSSANTAKEMGGSLVARSDGLGRGATFVLERPAAG